MKIVTIKMDLVIDDDICQVVDDIYDNSCISDYLNNKLYTDPEFFGDFGPENIYTIKEIE